MLMSPRPRCQSEPTILWRRNTQVLRNWWRAAEWQLLDKSTNQRTFPALASALKIDQVMQIKEYRSISEAVQGFLVHTCGLLANKKINHIVVGGWVPFLRGKHHRLVHPGTRDVDILFDDNREAIRRAANLLLDAEYLASAKHEFQLLKTLRVSGRNFVFNVDLMNPSEARESPELFSDILDLGVRDDYDLSGTRHIKSIAFPSAHVVFENSFWSYVDTEGLLPDGQMCRIKIPLLDEIGLIISKSESVWKNNRTRDPFDIFFTLAGQKYEWIIQGLSRTAKSSEVVQGQLASLNKYLRDKPEEFNRRVMKYVGRYRPEVPPAKFVAMALQSCF